MIAGKGFGDVMLFHEDKAYGIAESIFLVRSSVQEGKGSVMEVLVNPDGFYLRVVRQVTHEGKRFLTGKPANLSQGNKLSKDIAVGQLLAGAFKERKGFFMMRLACVLMIQQPRGVEQ